MKKLYEKYDAIVDKYKFLNAYHLAEVPFGWLELIEMMCEELSKVIDRDGLDYILLQAKEKYGKLTWYDMGGNEETDKIVNKYSEESLRVCCGCGKPATKVSTGWVSPWCDECAKEISGELKEL